MLSVGPNDFDSWLLLTRVAPSSLLDGRWRDEGWRRMTFVARLFGLLVHHVVVTRRANGLALQSAERAHVGDQLPDLVIGKPAAERRHSIRPSFDDRREDVLWSAPVDPFVVGEWRTYTTSAVRVTSRAVHLIEQTLAFGHGVGVVLV